VKIEDKDGSGTRKKRISVTVSAKTEEAKKGYSQR